MTNFVDIHLKPEQLAQYGLPNLAYPVDVAGCAGQSAGQGRKVVLISHVQEMTETIGTRVQAQKQSGGLNRIVAEWGFPARFIPGTA